MAERLKMAELRAAERAKAVVVVTTGLLQAEEGMRTEWGTRAA